ncbi:MAG: chloride channel protein [Nitrososphaerales archaeon]
MSKKTAERREESRIGLLSAISIGIGFAAGFIAFILYNLIGLLTNLFYYQRFSSSFVSPAGNTLGWVAILLPVIGGLLAGVMIKYGSTKIIGHGIPEAMESVLVNRSKIEPKVGILKALSAAVTIGSGQPFGAEGPIIQTGGAFGSFVGQLVPMTGSERKILLASGAAAGMAATFGTPISAILLVIELLLFEFRVKALVPIGIAAAIGGWMHFILISPTPLFQTPAYSFGNGTFQGIQLLPFFIVLGVLSGIMGSVLSRALYKTEDMFRKVPLGQPWLPAMGGLIVGLIGFAVPEILGVGYNIIGSSHTGILNESLRGAYPVIGLLLMIMVAKAAAWLLAMASQTSGGTLAPLFLVGSAMGFAYGLGVEFLFPSLFVGNGITQGISPAIFAIAAMGAVFGTASRAPFASIIFTMEVTGAFQGVLAIIITGVIAELVGEYLMEDSIMTEKLARRGLRIRNIYEYNPLRQIRVSALMTSPVASVKVDEKVLDVYKLLDQRTHEFFSRKRLVVLQDGKIFGIIDRGQIYDGALKADPSLEIGDICSKVVFTVGEDELGYEALRIMTLNDTSFVIVVDKEGSPKGYVSRGDLARAQKHKIEDETYVDKSFFSKDKNRIF